MKSFGFVFEPPHPADDVMPWRRLNVDEMADVMLEQNHLNLLAMILFVIKHADAQARAKCSFVTFPPERQFDLTSKDK